VIFQANSYCRGECRAAYDFLYPFKASKFDSASAKRIDYLYALKVFLIVGHDDAAIRLGGGCDNRLKAAACFDATPINRVAALCRASIIPFKMRRRLAYDGRSANIR
jgi:hypothetical protein